MIFAAHLCSRLTSAFNWRTMEKTRFPFNIEVDRQKHAVAYDVEFRVRAVDDLGGESLWNEPQVVRVKTVHEVLDIP